jgi:ribosomal protein S18 acetylase RimI-like enzyme
VSPAESLEGTTARARAWHHARHASICDVLEPWAHGTVVRATDYPNHYDYNLVRVEDEPGMSVEALAAVADEALAGLAHRRLDFDLIDAAAPLRQTFEASGWEAMRVVFMRHQAQSGPGGAAVGEEVPYDLAHDLRMAWHLEHPYEGDPGPLLAQFREVALRRGVRVLAVKERGVPVAFAQFLEHEDASAEITQVYVHPDHRGSGLGTAVTRAAIEAAGSVKDLWIAADDEGRAKDVYARLGFRSAWTTMEFERLT